MSELHLLDILAARHGCFISDLNLTPFLRRAALSDLCGMDENSYPLSQWQDAVRYLTGDERDFASIKEVKDFILLQCQQPGEARQPGVLFSYSRLSYNGREIGLTRL